MPCEWYYPKETGQHHLLTKRTVSVLRRPYSTFPQKKLVRRPVQTGCAMVPQPAHE